MYELIAKVNAKHIVVSYSTDGIIPENELLALLKNMPKTIMLKLKELNIENIKARFIIKSFRLYSS